MNEQRAKRVPETSNNTVRVKKKIKINGQKRSAKKWATAVSCDAEYKDGQSRHAVTQSRERGQRGHPITWNRKMGIAGIP